MIVSIIGNNGAGKTSLAKALGQQPGFRAFLERHTESPYQTLFSREPQRFALPNQIDFLLFRAEQEREIRAGDKIGVQDGGLEQDFFVYTHLFRDKGYLTEEGFKLCQRVYETIRAGQPAPEAFIYLSAPMTLLEGRLLERWREIDVTSIVTPDDLSRMQQYLGTLVVQVSPLVFGAAEVDLESAAFLSDLVERIRDM